MAAVVARFRPECRLVGENGNVFNLLAIAKNVLNRNDMRQEAAEMQARVLKCGGYDEALYIIEEYVDVV